MSVYISSDQTDGLNEVNRINEVREIYEIKSMKNVGILEFWNQKKSKFVSSKICLSFRDREIYWISNEYPWSLISSFILNNKCNLLIYLYNLNPDIW